MCLRTRPTGVGTRRRRRRHRRSGGVHGAAAGAEGTHGPELWSVSPPSGHEHLDAAPERQATERRERETRAAAASLTPTAAPQRKARCRRLPKRSGGCNELRSTGGSAFQTVPRTSGTPHGVDGSLSYGRSNNGENGGIDIVELHGQELPGQSCAEPTERSQNPWASCHRARRRGDLGPWMTSQLGGTSLILAPCTRSVMAEPETFQEVSGATR